MITAEEILRNSRYEDEILEVVDNQDNYTRSDLQGRVGAIVLNIVRESKSNEELVKRIRHQMWAVDTLAKTKEQKIRAEGQKDALEIVLAWINQKEG